MPGILAEIQQDIGDAIIRIVGLIGLGLGGAQAAAVADINAVRQDAWRIDPNQELSPATLAELVVKSVLDPGTAAGAARASGLNGDRFAQLVAGTGNPPGPQELLAMWRRGHITRDDAALGLRQGYLRNDWVEQVLALRHDVLSAMELVQAAVQDQVPYDEAKARADQVGIDGGDFDILYRTAGNPPGPMELLNLWVRGYISEADVDQGLRESRLKNKWIPALKALAVRKVPMRTITTLLRNGAIDHDRAQRMLRELGYSVDDAEAIIASATVHHTAQHREASITTIRELYVERIIDRAAAQADLVRAGLTEQAADLTLTLADSSAAQRLRRAAITRIHNLYVAHHETVAQASQRLDQLGVPADQRDYMLQIWSLEERANVHELTPAQVVSAGKRGLLDQQAVLNRLVRYGYSEDDAIIVATLGGAITTTTAGG